MAGLSHSHKKEEADNQPRHFTPLNWLLWATVRKYSFFTVFNPRSLWFDNYFFKIIRIYVGSFISMHVIQLLME